MNLENNQIIQLRNGLLGVVTSFNDVPFQIIFKAYTNPVSKYNAELKHTNNNYDIVAVFDGSTVESATNVFKAKFNTDSLTKVWEEKTV